MPSPCICPFLIMCSTSMPGKMTRAQRKFLIPSIDRVHRLIVRWSCSMMEFRLAVLDRRLALCVHRMQCRQVGATFFRRVSRLCSRHPIVRSFRRRSSILRRTASGSPVVMRLPYADAPDGSEMSARARGRLQGRVRLPGGRRRDQRQALPAERGHAVVGTAGVQSSVSSHGDGEAIGCRQRRQAGIVAGYDGGGRRVGAARRRAIFVRAYRIHRHGELGPAYRGLAAMRRQSRDTPDH